VVKGYEYDRGQFVTFSPDELKALDIESTGAVDLSTFVPRQEVDPLYFNTPYYVYPDGWIGVEAFQVLNAALTKAGLAGMGRITLSRRERMALIEPRGSGMVLITLRSVEEVKPANFGTADDEIDPEMVNVATTIIKRRMGTFDPSTFRDRYQDTLRDMIQAKLKGLPLVTQPPRAPAPVIDLMSALKRSLAQEVPTQAKPKPRGVKDRRQTNLLLPVTGAGTPGAAKVKRVATGKRMPTPRQRRKKA
jgi:DNA end-binding protein Ku